MRKGRADPDTQPVMINMGCVQTSALRSSHGAETQEILLKEKSDSYFKSPHLKEQPPLRILPSYVLLSGGLIEAFISYHFMLLRTYLDGLNLSNLTKWSLFKPK